MYGGVSLPALRGCCQHCGCNIHMHSNSDSTEERTLHPHPRKLQVAALSDRTQRLEAELQGAKGREVALQEELQAAKRAATALQRSPSKISGAWVGGREKNAGLTVLGRSGSAMLPVSPMHLTPPMASCSLPHYVPAVTAAVSTPMASRTLSELSDQGIPAVPAGAAAAAAAQAAELSAQRMAAVETLKTVAVQRRLPMVAVSLGGTGARLGCWACGAGRPVRAAAAYWLQPVASRCAL